MAVSCPELRPWGTALTLRQVFAVLRAQWVIILLAVLVSVGVAALVVLRASVVYEGSNTIRITWDVEGEGLAPLDVSTSAHDEAAREAVVRYLDEERLTFDGSVTSSSDGTVIVVRAQGTDQEVTSGVATAYSRGFIGSLNQQVERELERLEARRAAVTARVQDLQADTVRTPGNVLLRADLEAALASYTTVTSQIEATALAGSPGDLGPTSVNPVGAPPTRVLILAAVVGLIAGVGIALLRAQFDSRVQASEDVSTLLGLPVLGELPRGRALLRNPAAGLPVVEDPDSPVSTAVRELRTALQGRLADHRSPVVLVASADPDDGRTFLVANLAASWSLAGRPTIAVSGDLRTPHLAEFLPSELAEGLQRYLPEGSLAAPAGGESAPSRVRRGEDDGGVAREAWARRTSVDRLWLVTHETLLELVPNPVPGALRDAADLLATSEMRDLVGELRGYADLVLIDSPPALTVADASIWGAYADGVLLVARRGHTSDERLLRTAQRLRMNGATLLGIVLNG